MNRSDQVGNSLDMFQNSWTVYRKIVDNDYMFHREIYADLGNYLQQRFLQMPFSILDLGCGDASPTTAMLRGCVLSLYHGIDLSEAALEKAVANVMFLPCPSKLHLADMLAGLERVTEPVDVVFSSFALHHLSLEEKQRFFTLSRRALKPQGVLLLTDVMREPDQTRQRYLEDYLEHAARHWQALSPAELSVVSEHIRACDFPEPASLHAELAQTCGFSGACRLNQHTWHQSWVYDRSH